MKHWIVRLIPVFLLVTCSSRAMVPQLSMHHPANYEVLSAPVEGVSCEIGVFQPADFGRAILDAREKLNPRADGLIDVEFWYWKPSFESPLWLISHHCVSVTGTPVRLRKE